MTTTDQDIARLGLRARDHDVWQQAVRERMTERRQDDGYWLLWLALPLVLFGWHRGALVLVACTLWWTPSGPARAADWNAQWQHLWRTPEQRAPELIEQDPASAANRLQDPLWRGTALYRDGQYEGAADAFARSDSATAHYNRGNALARAGKPEAALEAWQEALARNPEHEGARQNQQIVRQYLEQQRQQQARSGDKRDNQDREGSGQGNSQRGGSKGSQPLPDDGAGDYDRPGGDDPASQAGMAEGNELSEQPGAQAGQQAGQGQAASGPGEQSNGAPAARSSADGRPGKGTRADALTQSQEQWLRRIPDDPGGLLRRKFLQQFRGRNTQPDENDTPW